MNKYIVPCSGWLEVEVEANSAKEAEELVLEERPDTAGELYDIEVGEALRIGGDDKELEA